MAKIKKKDPNAGGMLPDGEYTNSDRKYVDTWRETAKHICREFGLITTGFDPDISFVDPCNFLHTIQLPMWFVNRLNEIIEQANSRP